MKWMDMNRILENAMNPRNFEEKTQRTKLNSLIDSIQSHGLVSPPILYRKTGTHYYAPLDGHRRIRACRELGWERIPFISTKDMGLPSAMTDAEALQLMFETQGTNIAWKSGDTLHVIGNAVDSNQDFYVPKRMSDMKTVYGLAPAWLRVLMRNGNHSKRGQKRNGVGWTIVRDIFKFTTDETVVRNLVNGYMSRSIRDQRHMSQVIGCMRDAQTRRVA